MFSGLKKTFVDAFWDHDLLEVGFEGLLFVGHPGICETNELDVENYC